MIRVLELLVDRGRDSVDPLDFMLMPFSFDVLSFAWCNFAFDKSNSSLNQASD